MILGAQDTARMPVQQVVHVLAEPDDKVKRVITATACREKALLEGPTQPACLVKIGGFHISGRQCTSRRAGNNTA